MSLSVQGETAALRTLRLAHWWLKLAGMALLIVACRWQFIDVFGSPVPFWDQWDVEARDTYLPLQNFTLSIADLAATHNEHCIFWSRMLDLLLLELNGQWDPRLQMAVNAMLAAAAAVVLALVLRRLCGTARLNRILLLLSVLSCLPFGWENTLWGFQSQVYILILLAELTFWGLLLTRNFSPGWWIGALSAVGGCLAMGSGFFAGAVVLAIKLWQIVFADGLRRRHVPAAVAGAVSLFVGLLLFQPMPPHDPAHAEGLAAFVTALGKGLAWPLITLPYAAPLLYLPVVLLLASAWRSRGRLNRAQVFLLAMCGWLLLNAMGIAYSRGAHGAGPSTRHFDILALGAVVNAAALMLLGNRRGWRERNRRLLRWGLGGVWTALLAVGVIALSNRGIVAAGRMVAPWSESLMACRAYLLSPPPRRPPEGKIPCPDPLLLGALLEEPIIQRIFPAVLQVPPPLRAAAGKASAFVLDGVPEKTGSYLGESVIGSFHKEGTAAATAAFESESLTANLPYLQIPIAGYPCQPGCALQLVIENTGEVLPITLAADPQETWQCVTVRAPATPFRIVAKDENAEFWFALAAPRQVGRLSYLCELLLPWAWTVGCLGVALLLLSGLGSRHSRGGRDALAIAAALPRESGS